MEKLTFEKASQILPKHITEENLIRHSLAVAAAMEKMAEHFGEDMDYWKAIGYLHDVDYEKYPDEHLEHTPELLSPEGVSEQDIRSILSHGWGLLNDIKPETNLEKSLYTVDELTGIITATALMRPDGIDGMQPSSVLKKFKDKRFAAKCNREVIKTGCVLLGMQLSEVIDLCISGMQKYGRELQILS
jgi:putative nucleotidyltransferase with HDIG domain